MYFTYFNSMFICIRTILQIKSIKYIQILTRLFILYIVLKSASTLLYTPIVTCYYFYYVYYYAILTQSIVSLAQLIKGLICWCDRCCQYFFQCSPLTKDSSTPITCCTPALEVPRSPPLIITPLYPNVWLFYYLIWTLV